MRLWNKYTLNSGDKRYPTFILDQATILVFHGFPRSMTVHTLDLHSNI
jgi:hypothetical protein